MALYPVILCGGSGSRLWPLSRTLLPKQFLALAGTQSMFQQTAGRLSALPGAMGPVVVSNMEQRFLAREQLREAGIEPSAHLLEPVGRNTAPAIAAAALVVARKDPQALLLVAPSDHVIRDQAAFADAVHRASVLASMGRLVTFGVVPTVPATGYGYILPGAPEAGVKDAYSISRFVEKPDEERAREYIAQGAYWNSGMFLFRACRYLEELRRFRPDIAAGVEAAIGTSTPDLDFVRLDEAAFSRCPAQSVDYAVMEKTEHASVVAARFEWSDVGSWRSLWSLSDKDAAGNSQLGDVVLDQASGCYVRAESRLVAALGVQDLVIIETGDAVLVANKDKAEDVKGVVEHLKAMDRPEQATHDRVYRPWGYYESIDSGPSYQVKRLMLKKGARISLQRHRRRAEHWVVVAGKAKVTRGEEQIVLGPNQSTFIPLGTIHRLENVGDSALFVVEVQSGDYLGEDDIERFDDDYKRA
jgi:mannose-1-phosphate guanylyltransferase / mannose-6-phosphate isomerase